MSRSPLKANYTESRDHRDFSWAEGDRGERYVAVSGNGDIYDVSVTLGDGTTTVLASGVSPGQAYSVCVRHYHGPLEGLS